MERRSAYPRIFHLYWRGMLDRIRIASDDKETIRTSSFFVSGRGAVLFFKFTSSKVIPAISTRLMAVLRKRRTTWGRSPPLFSQESKRAVSSPGFRRRSWETPRAEGSRMDWTGLPRSDMSYSLLATVKRCERLASSLWQLPAKRFRTVPRNCLPSLCVLKFSIRRVSW